MAQAQLLRAVSAGVTLPAVAALAAGIVVALASPLGAQTTTDIDLAQVRARAAQHADDADAFARAVAKRGDTVRREAQIVADNARASVARGSSASATSATATFDFDAMVRHASASVEGDTGPRLIAFASLAMPAGALRQLIDDTGRAGGAVVFRGLPGNSARVFTTALAKVVPEGRIRANLGIDPRLFRAFAIEAVPAYVVTSDTVDLCDGLDCRSTPPPHDILRGNVTLDYALQTFARGSGPAARAADTRRRRAKNSPAGLGTQSAQT